MVSSYFLRFFHRLRELAGLELDMNQYFLFLELFMLGHGIDRSSLETLCKTLWLTKTKYRDTFEKWFDEAYRELRRQWLPDTLSKSKEERRLSESQNLLDENGEKKILPPDSNQLEFKIPKLKKIDEERPGKNEIISGMTEILLNFEEGKGISNLASRQVEKNISEKRSVYIFSPEKILPVNSRQLKHALHRLSLSQKHIISNRLDIKGIVKQISKEQLLSDIIYEQVVGGNQNVVLLTDHLGSMAAFEHWGNFLYQSLKQCQNIAHIDRYYFHDYPSINRNSYDGETFKLYFDVGHTVSRSVEKVFHNLNNKVTWLIIFSDAGAYESILDSECLSNWMIFLELIRKKVKAVTWINPLPEQRWEGTMGDSLSFLVPMVPFNIEGIKKAIKLASNAN